MIRVSRDASDADWDRFVEAHPDATIYHSTAWQQAVHDAFGKETLRLCAQDADGQIVGILPLVLLKNWLLGKNLVSVPYANYGGALVSSEAAGQALAAEAGNISRELRCDSLELRDFERRAFDGYSQRTDKVMMLLSLPETIEELQKSIGAKVRSQIRRPAREGAEVAQGGAKLIDEFYPVFCRNMRDLGTPVYPIRFFRSIYKHLGDSCRIVVVRLNGETVAACFLIGYKNVLEIPWAASNRDFNRYGVNMMLYWHALTYAYEAGYDTFDFGRSTTEGGTFRFKKQWGAEPHALTWHRIDRKPQSDETDRPGMADRAVGTWQRLPLPLANWLGPKVSADLPW